LRLLRVSCFWLCISRPLPNTFNFSPEDGCRMFLRNDGIRPKFYTPQIPRRS
jgi:hypothetical protein